MTSEACTLAGEERGGWGDAGGRDALIAAQLGPAVPSVATARPGPVGGGSSGGAGGSHQLDGAGAAARCQAHLPEPFEQGHVELGLLLIAVELQLDEHLPLGSRHVVRGEPIQRVHEDVAAAGVAPAEAGELGPELRVFSLNDLEGDVRYPTTASSCPASEALKVDPVVPVKRTRR